MFIRSTWHSSHACRTASSTKCVASTASPTTSPASRQERSSGSDLRSFQTISTGADALTADELAGALIVLAETKDAGKREAWAKRGAAFFQGRVPRSASSLD